MKKVLYGKFSVGEVLLAGYAFVFAQRILVPFHRLLFHVALRGLGVFNSINFRISGERYLIHKWLSKMLAAIEQPVFFDVGANEGNFSMELNAAFPHSCIYAFEPHPATRERAKERLGSAATVFHCGLGDECKTMTLYDVAGEAGTSHASLYADVVIGARKGVSSVEVQVRTLDEVAAAEGVERIDFLKIDTEGNEYPVLLGARRLLEQKAIGIIHFEFNEMNIVSGYFLRDFQKLLDGYRLYRLLPHGLLELNDMPVLTELYGFQNIIAIRKDLSADV